MMYVLEEENDNLISDDVFAVIFSNLVFTECYGC